MGWVSETSKIAVRLMLLMGGGVESGSLQHPTMASLSIPAPITAALKVIPKSFLYGHPGSPTQLRLQFQVAVIRLFPIGVPCHEVEDRFQLALRPGRISLPQRAERIAQKVGDIDGLEPLYIFFV